MASGKANKYPHVEEIGSSGAWSWILYDDKTIDLYLNTRVVISNYSASTFGGLYEFGPFDLPFALETGFAFLAGCKVGNGISIIALCNTLSATKIDVVGQTNLTGTQSCDVYVHLHGKKAG